MLLLHEGTKRDTIGVTRKVGAKLPYHRGSMSAYLMKNETPFVYHIASDRDVIVQSKKTKA
jgi:hypothetical protein